MASQERPAGSPQRKRQRSLVVTGATSPIGRAIFLWAKGNRFQAIGTVRSSRRGGGGDSNDSFLYCDFGDPESVTNCVKAIHSVAPEVDVLVNNVSAWHQGGLLSQEPIAIRQDIDITLGGTLDFTRRMLPSLLSCGGLVINLCSTAGTQRHWSLNTTYVTAKAGLAVFGHALRRELAGSGLRVTNLHLGAVDDGDAGTKGCLPIAAIVQVISLVVNLPRAAIADAVILTPACRDY